MKRKTNFIKLIFLILIIFILFLFFCCIPDNVTDQKEEKDDNEAQVNSDIKYSGIRASSYGITPFPSSSEWETCIKKISDFFSDTQCASIWIVGSADLDNQGIILEFPSPGGDYDKVTFFSADEHEGYLDYFDVHNIKILLQIEPGFADVETLIDLVLNQYKHHSCVIGLGIDVEWYNNASEGNSGEKISNTLAFKWESKVKSHNVSYKLFLKHWNRDWMPPNYRGDILFVDDSQNFDSLNQMVYEFSYYWADYFYPNTVLFQIGYESDRSWWNQLSNPIPDIGNAVSNKVKQNCGILWVDFTVESVISFR